MRTLLLSSDDIGQITRRIGVDALMGALIERLHLAFGDGHEHSYAIPARGGFHYDSPVSGLVEWMPLWQRGRRVMMKMVGYHPANPSTRGLPTVLSTVSLFDAATGHLEAMMDGTLATALRTGAASAVASRLLASPQSRSLGVIGCGAQAVTQVHALSQVFPLEHVLAFDVDGAAAHSLERRCALFRPDGLSFSVCGVEEVVANADILCTATSVEVGGGPVFSEVPETRPWLHINAVGSDLPGKTEVPLEVLQRGTVCPDFLKQAQHEGECQQLRAEQIGPGIVEVARGAVDLEELRQQLTIFDSTGFALEDLIVMELFLEHAAELGVGTAVGMESLAEDPHNPYGCLDPDRVPGQSIDRAKEVMR